MPACDCDCGRRHIKITTTAHELTPPPDYPTPPCPRCWETPTLLRLHEPTLWSRIKTRLLLHPTAPESFLQMVPCGHTVPLGDYDLTGPATT